MKCPKKYKNVAYQCDMYGRMGFIDTLPYLPKFKKMPG